MDTRRYFTALRKHWLVLTALTVLGGLLAGLYSATQPVLYQATSSVFVSTQRGETTTELLQGSSYTLAAVESYAELATLPAVLQPVIEKLQLDTTPGALANHITTQIRLNTVIIEVTASAGTAQGAADLANAVTESLSTVVTSLAPTATDATPAVTLSPVAPAAPPSAPYSPRYLLLILAGLGIGLLLGILYAIGRDLFDTRLRTEDDVRAAADTVPYLGSVERRRSSDLPHLMFLAEPNSAAAEDYRRLCTNLEFAGIDNRVRAISVTSALAGDGKTTTALNLAAAIAERGHRVLVVDADLRRPALAGYVNIEGAVGLTNVLLGGVSADDAIQRVGTFDVLPSGTTPPNVTQLVTSESMGRLFAELRTRYDFVVVDTPPVLAVPDALTIANLTDGALLVARSKVTRSKQLVEAVDALTFVNAVVLGIVLNGVPHGNASTYGYDQIERGDTAALPASAQPPTSFFRGGASSQQSAGSNFAEVGGGSAAS
ncbi:polysaccharide biosynthesis tyrosine autokinase [Naasia aerilata]|uniref:non-specific protein-tyrosine kinase n=1 Tax=Naasia aerilata TaxID=1162966 RepID=A0ABN6XLX4_9MICO|nr:polysaccharide biosynthesis tyrosine autokinase [Naasia aerilata]BDZ45928.1 capsular exopolysaccharide biosynthesis protein [Naasia aerilata]